MVISFRPAVRENLPLLIGLCGGTGSGKTMSGMEIATGLTPKGKKFAVIDTENGRALHYADRYSFDHGRLDAPFTPQAYLVATQAAAKAGYPVILIDSMSHEWAGVGGVLDMHEAELQRMAGDDYKKRDAMLMASWIKPKGEHKKMVQAFLQVPAHIIFCFRAESKIEMERNANGKMEIHERVGPTGFGGWFPVCEKNLPYELTVSMMFLADNPGIPRPIKVEDQFRLMIPSSRTVTSDAGRLLGAWAAGGEPQQAQPVPQAQTSAPEPPRAARETETPVFVPEPMLDVQGNAVDPDDLPFDDAEPPVTEMEDVIAQRATARNAPAFVPPSGDWWAEFQAGAKSASPPVLAAQIRNVMQRPVTMKHTFDYICEKRLTWPELLATAGKAPA